MPTPIPVVKEGSATFLTFSFKDEDGNPTVPTTIEWRIDDITNCTLVMDWTLITPPSDTVTVTIPGTLNIIASQANLYEDRLVAVRINGGLAPQAHDDRRYRIKNLHAVT